MLGIGDGLKLAALFVVLAWLAIDRASLGKRAAMGSLFLVVHCVAVFSVLTMTQFSRFAWNFITLLFHVPALAVVAYVAGFLMRFFRRWKLEIEGDSGDHHQVNLASIMELTVVIAFAFVFFGKWTSSFHGNTMAITLEAILIGIQAIGTAFSVLCLFRIILIDESTSNGKLRDQVQPWVWLFVIHFIVWATPILGFYYPNALQMATHERFDAALMVVSLNATATIAASLGVICLRQMGYRLRNAVTPRSEETRLTS